MSFKDNDNTTSKSSSVGEKYFKSSIAGLNVVVGKADYEAGEVAPKSVRFVPYTHKIAATGDTVRIGFLATNNATAISKLAKDPNVEVISEKEYLDGTDTDNKNIKRAAY